MRRSRGPWSLPLNLRGAIGAVSLDPAILTADSTHCPGSEKDITEVSGTSSPGSTPGRGTLEKAM
jgi:hypothetical protein